MGNSEALILAAAKTDVDECERDAHACMTVNRDAVKTIAAGCSNTGSGLIFYSTDYVFDGSGPKGEGAEPSPINVYGRSKLEAEVKIQEQCEEHLILRINVPLAPAEDGNSFYSFVVNNLKSGNPINVVTDQWNNPLDTDRIAKWSLEAWKRGVRGILHLGGGTYATRYDIARMIAEYIDADQSLISPCKTQNLNQIAPRPRRAGLLVAKQTELFGTAPDLPNILKSIPN